MKSIVHKPADEFKIVYQSKCLECTTHAQLVKNWHSTITDTCYEAWRKQNNEPENILSLHYYHTIKIWSRTKHQSSSKWASFTDKMHMACSSLHMQPLPVCFKLILQWYYSGLCMLAEEHKAIQETGWSQSHNKWWQSDNVDWKALSNCY